jgi:hypothetical protein
MPISFKHTVQAQGADSGDERISANAWNNDHTLTMGSGYVLGRVTVGDGAVEELTPTQIKNLIGFDAALDGKLTVKPDGFPDFPNPFVVGPAGSWVSFGVAQETSPGVMGAAFWTYADQYGGVGFYGRHDANWNTWWGFRHYLGQVWLEGSHPYRFTSTPFVNGSNVWHSGNLTFGSGLSLNGNTLSATGGGGGGGTALGSTAPAHASGAGWVNTGDGIHYISNATAWIEW